MTQLAINNEHQITISMFFVMANFEKNMNTFAILTELLMNDKVMTITDDLKSIHKLIQK